jgi:hypothetical protein
MDNLYFIYYDDIHNLNIFCNFFANLGILHIPVEEIRILFIIIVLVILFKDGIFISAIK